MSAARFVPALRQPIARAAVAGPSTLRAPFLARAATTAASNASGASGDAASAAAAAAAAQGQSAPEADSIHSHEAEESALPSNLSFEDLSGARKQVSASLDGRGVTLHSKPADPFEPIMHPLSSLASPTPTAAAAEAPVVSLPADVFRKPMRRDILHRNVVWYLSTLRAGNQGTRTRASVAFSGKKVRPQKGSGRARQGDAGAGTRRKGAPIHPLVHRDWAQSLNRKVRELGLQTALSAKLGSGLLRVVASLNEGAWPGTNDARRSLADGALDVDGAETLVERFGPAKDLSILFLHAPNKPASEVEELWRVVRNIPNIEVLPTDEVVAYDVLKYRWVVLEAGAIDALAAHEITYEFEGGAGTEEWPVQSFTSAESTAAPQL